MNWTSIWAWLQSEDVLPWTLLAGLSVALHTLIFFKSNYSAEKWALRRERAAVLKGGVYAMALPFRLLFSVLSALVATVVWACLGLGVWVLWRTLQG